MALVGSALAIGGCKKVKLDEDHLIERPLGALSRVGVEMQYRSVHDPLMVSFVDDIGQAYLPYVKRHNVPYRFTVLDAGMVNAFAIPWGGIYVTRGLLEFADTEDEIAFVMGHEIGHVEGRHSVKRFKKQMLVSLGLSAVENQDTRSWVHGLQVASFFVFQKYSRDQEYDADRRGAGFSFDASYDPRGGTAFFAKLRRRYGDQPRLFVWFSTHPLTRDRIGRIERYPQLDFTTVTVNRRVAGGYLRRGMFHQAQALYLAALQRDRRDAESYAGLAQAAYQLGQMTLAQAAVQRAVALAPDHPAVREARGLLATRQAPIVMASRRAAVPVQSIEWQALQGEQEHLRTRLQGEQERSRALAERLGQESDSLHQQFEQLAWAPGLEVSLQETVARADKVLSLAHQAMTEILSAQEQALDGLEWAEKIGRWGAAWTADDRRPSGWLPAAHRQARAGLEDLSQAVTEMPDALEATGRTVADVQRALDNLARGIVRRDAVFVATDLQALERRLERSLERTAVLNQRVSWGRGRILGAAIDAVMSYATEAEQRAAVPLFAHLLRTPESEVAELWQESASPGEVALAAAGAKSSRQPVSELSARAHRSGDWLVAVAESKASLWAVETSLNVLATTLERELQPEQRQAGQVVAVPELPPL